MREEKKVRTGFTITAEECAHRIKSHAELETARIKKEMLNFIDHCESIIHTAVGNNFSLVDINIEKKELALFPNLDAYIVSVTEEGTKNGFKMSWVPTPKNGNQYLRIEWKK